MAADYQALVANLLAFHDLSGLDVVAVGAGGGQLIEYARPTRHVTAVDCSEEALARLQTRVTALALDAKVTPFLADFLDLHQAADLVLFEFCLHEMDHPDRALAHGLALAPAVLVVDHDPDSPWAFVVGENDKAMRSWQAVTAMRPVREQACVGAQAFADYRELYEKVRSQGEPALTRAAAYREWKTFTIPMLYRMALLRRQ